MLHDLRFAARSLRKSPCFTLVAVAMLALGIAASTACFSFLNAFFLRPPPFAQPRELVSLHTVDERSPGLARVSYPNFTDFRASNTAAFADLAFHMYTGLRYGEGPKAENLFGVVVTANYFELLGVTAARGRALTPADDRDGAPPVVVVSHAFWQNRLGADPAAIGRTLLFNDTAFTLVGVAPAEFRGVSQIDAPEFWVPVSAQRIIFQGTGLDYFLSRRAVAGSVAGRLKPGVTLEQAEAALKPVAQKLAADYPTDNAGRSVRLIPITRAMLDPNSRSDMLRAGNLLMALSGSILLLACANLANLLLARAGARQREVALRVALGASRPRVIRQLLVENFLLAALGGAVGVLTAHWLRDLLWLLRPRGFTENVAVTMDAGVLVFAVATTLFTGLLFGLVPALTAARVNLVAVLKREAPGAGVPLWSFRNLLVAGQVALSVVALVIAGLFVRSLQQANVVDLGWNSRGLALVTVNPSSLRGEPGRTLEYYDRALERLRTVPGVIDASLASRPFLTGVNPQRTIRPQCTDEAMRTRGLFMSYSYVEPGFLRFMGVGLVAGRDFTADDDFTHPRVVIISETFARRYWPGEDPLGKNIKLFNDDTLLQVVGVTRDIRDVELRAAPAPYAYFPAHQQFQPNLVLHVRTTGDPATLLPTLRKELQLLDANIPVTATFTYDDIVRFAMWGPRTGAALMSAFGLIALTLTSLGIYALMSHAVGQRTREIGIRLAIGAQARTVVGLVLKRGVIVTGTGLVAGLGASLAVTRYLRGFLFEIDPTDPLTFAAIAAILGTVALLACILPAHRATKIDPIIALRAE